MFARLGVFGPVDLVVSGINPGANVGRAIYHSGTVGAALTARNGGTSGVAVSQAVAGLRRRGPGLGRDDRRPALGHRGRRSARPSSPRVLDAPAGEPFVVNVNVPNVPFDDDRRMAPRRASPCSRRGPSRPGGCTRSRARRRVRASRWCGATPIELPPDTDSGAIERGEVAVSYLSRLQHEARPDLDAVGRPAGRPARAGSYTPAMSERTRSHAPSGRPCATRYLLPRDERPPTTAGGVHHTAHLSSDVARTIDFYQGLLGFPLTELFENRDYRRLDALLLRHRQRQRAGLLRLPRPRPAARTPRCSAATTTWPSASSPTQWQVLKGRLDDAGIEYLEVGGVSLYFRGPDGERLELLADPLGEMYGMQVV